MARQHSCREGATRQARDQRRRLRDEPIVDDPLARDFVAPQQKIFADEIRPVGKPIVLRVDAAALLDHLRHDGQPVGDIEEALEADDFVGFVREFLFDLQFALIVQARVYAAKMSSMPTSIVRRTLNW